MMGGDQLRVAISVEPCPGESLPGYLTRVADRNILQRPADLLTGLGGWPPERLTERQQDLLAGVLGLRPKDLQALFERTYRTGLPGSLLNFERRRLSPASLRQFPHHRAAWLIKPLDYCSESWCELIDRCPSCTRALRWTPGPVGLCGLCGSDLTTVETPEIPMDVRKDLKVAVDLATSRSVSIQQGLRGAHSDLRGLTPPQLFELGVICGRALSPSAQLDGYRNLAAGVALLRDYPDSILDLADTIENTTEHMFFRRLGVAAQARTGALRRLMDIMGSMAPAQHGVVRLKSVRLSREKMTATELAAALKVEKAQIPIMAKGGVFGSRSPRGKERRYDWFSVEDLERARMFLEGRMFASRWAKQVGLSLADVHQLVGVGLLRSPSDPAVDQVYGNRLQLERDSRLRFESDLLSCIRFSATRCGSDWVLLKHAFDMLGAAYKPWAPVLTAALTGDLPFGLRCSGGRELKLDRLRVHHTVADDLRRRALSRCIQPYRVTPSCFGVHRPSRLSRTEVQTYLNCYPADVSRLVERKLLRVLYRDPLAVDARSVEAFADRHVSTIEVASLFELAPGQIRWILTEAGFSRTESGFWSRRDLWGSQGIIARLRRARPPVIAVWELPGPSGRVEPSQGSVFRAGLCSRPC